VVVEPMSCGEAHWTREYFEWEGGSLGARIETSRVASDYAVPVPVFLVHHQRAGDILVDTGLHPSVASDPRQNMGRILGRYVTQDQGGDAVSQLRAKGLGPGDISVVVMTHLHADHASAMSEFPESTFVFSAEEWREATTGSRPTLNGYRRSHFDHAFDYRSVDFDTVDLSSYGPFGRCFDLFGDGSVRLAYTPGHTAGHLSVILRLPRRDFVVAGDAIFTWRQLEGGPEPAKIHDLHNWHRSLRELQHYHRAYPYAIIVPGHDPEFWAKLDDRYAE
jgi:N-acyl homoserine lactone hydrolase